MPWAAAHRPARPLAVLLALLLCTQALLLGAGTPAFATTSLNAEGSSWAGPAIDQWRTDVTTQGIQIDFKPNGSAAGRQQWEAGQDDFTASDVPFRTKDDTGAGAGIHTGGGGNAENPVYGYSYVPITAGGTAFMYNLTLAGKRVTDLRLSPDNLVDIFTGKITYWDDPKITASYGRTLPHVPVTPVIRSDGSGATAQFTRWMEHTHQSQWDAYCTGVNGVTCGDYTEFFPPSGRMVAQNGSDIVAGYVMSQTGLGSIGYDEYAFAKSANWPVVKVLNPAGYYTLPTASNVAVALTAAKIRGVDDNTSPNDPNYLQQNLDGVYTNADPRSYPVSSYSYVIVPRAGATLPVPPRFNNPKGAALSQFLSYVLCQGQGEVSDIGYSPIPRGLVRGGLLQTAHIPGDSSTVDPNTLSNCANPTFNAAGQLTILVSAPQPSPCDKVGTPIVCTVTNGRPTGGSSGSGSSGSSAGGTGTGTGGGSGSGSSGGSGSTGGGGSGSGGSGGAAGTGGSTGGANGTGTGGSSGGSGAAGSGAAGTAGAATPGAAGGASDSGAPVIDPQTGEQIAAGGSGGGTGSLAAASVVAVGGRPEDWVLSSLTALELLAVVAVPPFLGGWLIRRRRSDAVSGGPR
ncbi:substrate-binding domain-containing protein [Kitasatospora mediocidica]|uniref:substrate-binding domain-containing protein n=1 Tax=Kitasatospora mediocidica TaxID=58352 RepID=UPI000A036C07|nr:substrate-binding domain-containing protein [Kitasatospora mediocidica]